MANQEATMSMELVLIVKKWLNAMYRAGAVTIHPNGTLELNPDVRNLVKAMHAQLAAGDVKITIADQGTEVFSNLETSFEQAWAGMNGAISNMGITDGQLDPIAP